MDFPHGGDLYGKQVVCDFSANINPLGIPAPVRAALHGAVDACAAYPDPFARELTHALAARYGLRPEQIFCGAGASEIFFRLADCLGGKNVLLPAPTFAEYERALTHFGCTLRFHTLRAEENFDLTARILDEITEEIGAVFLCTPNNPTGRLISEQLMRAVVSRCRETGAWLMVDECFLDFCEGAFSARALLGEYDRLVVVRAFTKLHALPGVRLGWCMCGDPAVIEGLRRAGPPWNVSSFAQAAGLAALTMDGFEDETARYVAERRRALREGLTALGLTVVDGAANYLFFRSSRTDLCTQLAARGILLRDCSNFRGLSAGDYRCAVRTEEENALLLGALREVL